MADDLKFDDYFNNVYQPSKLVRPYRRALDTYNIFKQNLSWPAFMADMTLRGHPNNAQPYPAGRVQEDPKDFREALGRMMVGEQFNDKQYWSEHLNPLIANEVMLQNTLDAKKKELADYLIGNND